MVVDNYDIYEDGSIYVQRNNDKTNTYTFHQKNGKAVDLGTLQKSQNGMVTLSNKTAYYEYSLSGQGINSLPGDAAAGFLGATYSHYAETGYTTKVNQFMTSDWIHSGKKKDVACIDIQYVGISTNPSWKQAETQNNDVDISSSENLINSFSKFGFNNRSEGGNFLTTNAEGTDAALNGSKYYSGHQNHIHVQDFKSSQVKLRTPTPTGSWLWHSVINFFYDLDDIF